MTVQIPTRFREIDAAAIDDLVERGVARSRSDLIRHAVHAFLDAQRRQAIAEEMVAAYEAQPQDADDDEWALANAIAMTEAEPW